MWTDGLRSLLLADDLWVVHPGLGVYAWRRHDPAHASASRPDGLAKGMGIDDFDLAHLVLGHLRATLADAEGGERDVDSLGVRRNLLLEPVHVDDYFRDFGSAKAFVLRRVTKITLMHRGLLIRRCRMRPPTFPVAPSTIAEYCTFAPAAGASAAGIVTSRGRGGRRHTGAVAGEVLLLGRLLHFISGFKFSLLLS